MNQQDRDAFTVALLRMAAKLPVTSDGAIREALLMASSEIVHLDQRLSDLHEGVAIIVPKTQRQAEMLLAAAGGFARSFRGEPI